MRWLVCLSDDVLPIHQTQPARDAAAGFFMGRQRARERAPPIRPAHARAGRELGRRPAVLCVQCSISRCAACPSWAFPPRDFGPLSGAVLFCPGQC